MFAKESKNLSQVLGRLGVSLVVGETPFSPVLREDAGVCHPSCFSSPVE